MSGIVALFNLDGAPVVPAELQCMTSMLIRRGPEGLGVWHDGPIGLGHTLLATTPEAVTERQPFEHPTSGCAITADVRLDNRPELLRELGLDARGRVIGDAEIVLHSYLKWERQCVDRLLGDFAFVVWDPRRQVVLCARDRMGLRPCYVHYAPGKLLAISSEPRAILALERIPYRINEVRIADFLLWNEGADRRITFFEGVERIPSAHVLTVTTSGANDRRYWRPEPGPELRLGSDTEYAEAFLEVFTESVRCRLRSDGPVSSMLSGGLDSGSVVAVASQIIEQQAAGPLATFSAVSPLGRADVETAHIQDSMEMRGIAATAVSHGDLLLNMPELGALVWELDEPFDWPVLLRCMYLESHRAGHKVMLDGAGSDVVLSHGGYLAELAAQGHLVTLARELRGVSHFWSGRYIHPVPEFMKTVARAVASATAPRAFRRQVRALRIDRSVTRALRDSGVDPAFARQVRAAERLRASRVRPRGARRIDCRVTRSQAIDDPHLVAGRERYARIASSVAVEARDPFLDNRVIDFCLTLPGNQVLRNGWPKAILRRSLAGRLPVSVLRRRGRDHLGWDFIEAVAEPSTSPLGVAGRLSESHSLAPYINRSAKTRKPATDDAVQVYFLAQLAAWLDSHADRRSC